MAGFLCRACGECCRHVGAAITTALALPADSVLHQAGAAFPHDVLPDGSCAQLQADNKCGCYESRPMLCDVDRLFDALALENVSREEWHALNASACPPALP